MATPVGNEGFISELDVRIWLRDKDPKANKLIEDYEFTPEEIRTATTLVVDHWNDVPPDIIRYTLETFPYRYYLLMGTVANLLFIAANSYRRNHLNYNVPGGSIADQDKAPAYDAKGDKLWGEYVTWERAKKSEINAASGYCQI
jgi:hypothetical protein